MQAHIMKKRLLITGSVVILVAVLAGAAYVGGEMLVGRRQGSNPFVGLSNSGKAGGGLYLTVVPAQGIPTSPPAAIGAFIRRADNSIFIGNSSKQVQIQPANQGGGAVAVVTPSSAMELVITTRTQIYSDVTSRQFTTPPQNGQTVQQVVERGQVGEIGEGSTIQVWGQRDGDRIIADVLLYTVPSYLPKGVPKP